ncbi:hypothetical protein KVV02_001121 [Mortierella alpina]|uniref:triacylglycerol lipase n=1 Tax=Mortierella alpina TaxID=64518 RepID=A0A9P7ZYM6_MORAP|nr:hypothetical protein KVV02_001121 [Mortierella alpina]
MRLSHLEMSAAATPTPSNVKIIIVGAGICGLMTAIQLERAGMDYIVIEKSRTLTVFGAGLSLTPACNHILDQLAMLDEIKKASHPCAKIDYLRDDLSKIGAMNAGDNKGRYGYDGILITRPTFYDILLSKVPKEKVHWENEYPVLKEKSGDFYVLIGKEKAIQVYLFTFAENRLGWHICGRMDKPEEHDEKDFRFSDWADISKSFEAYYGYRSANAKEVFKSTSLVASILSSRGFVSEVVRFFALGHLPDAINNMGMDGMNTDRPYLCFLPPPPGQGSVKPKPQAIPVHYQRASVQPDPDPSARFVSKSHTFQLQHILAHGAPGAKSANVFRSLVIDDKTRMEMAQANLLMSEGSPSPGSTFEHMVSDSLFPLEDEDGAKEGEDDVEKNTIPLPWKRVPNAKDHGTVVSMVRMALDCYVDPKRQGWVDIGDKWDVDTELGWLETGLRGYIFVSEDQKTVVLGIKGTSLKLFGTGGGPTGNNDKLNDNKMFSCCCGKVDRTWWGVCGCYLGGNKCDQQCLVDDLIKDRDEETSYHGIGLVSPCYLRLHFAKCERVRSQLTSNDSILHFQLLPLQKVIEAARELYPKADIWLTGHSLGGSVASMLGITKGYPTFTFQTPGDARYAKRVGLVKQNLSGRDLKKMPVWQFGHTADPVFMGTCNGPTSSCYSAGYALETKCHLGRTCIYDTMTELGWRQNIQAHTIFTFIGVVENWPNMTQGREVVPGCLPQINCEDCTQWEYV